MSVEPQATTVDPLLDLIQRYRSQLEIFVASPDNLSKGEYQSLAAVTYRPLWEQLCECPPAPTTVEGAMGGLDFVAEQLMVESFSQALLEVLVCCKVFLAEHLSVSA